MATAHDWKQHQHADDQPDNSSCDFHEPVPPRPLGIELIANKYGIVSPSIVNSQSGLVHHHGHSADSWLELAFQRVGKGISQERLALESGTDRSYVGRVERGTENVTLDRLDAFAAVLNITVAQLLTEPTTVSQSRA